MWVVWLLYGLLGAFLLFAFWVIFWPMKTTLLPPLPSTGDRWEDATQAWERAAKLWRDVG
jgi:hypothetical protein